MLKDVVVLAWLCSLFCLFLAVVVFVLLPIFRVGSRVRITSQDFDPGRDYPVCLLLSFSDTLYMRLAVLLLHLVSKLHDCNKIFAVSLLINPTGNPGNPFFQPIIHPHCIKPANCSKRQKENISKRKKKVMPNPQSPLGTKNWKDKRKWMRSRIIIIKQPFPINQSERIIDLIPLSNK